MGDMAEVQALTCVHHWVLSEPRLGTVLGVCRRCGAHRNYPSALEYFEAVPEYEELDRSRPVLFAEPVS